MVKEGKGNVEFHQYQQQYYLLLSSPHPPPTLCTLTPGGPYTQNKYKAAKNVPDCKIIEESRADVIM